MVVRTDFWSGKRVLLTGHTGFKGGWLALWLQALGAEVVGIALPPETLPNLFDLAQVAEGIESHFCDIRDRERLSNLVKKTRPEITFHLAAQPLVRASYGEPVETFSTNIMGTVNLLEAMRGLESVKVAVMVTTDKVYKNLEHPYPYREDDALGGYDPYSASKAASELVISSYRDSFLMDQGVAVASARAGNVIGGGDWSEDRLIPDAVRAWQKGMTLQIRRPYSTRPWQHVLEPLIGYQKLAESLWQTPELAGSYNFGPHTHESATVQRVIEIARQVYGSGGVSYGDGTEGPHEAGYLALEIAKSREVLSVEPKWDIDEAINRTMAWYRDQHQGADARELCLAEIANYESCE